MVLSDRVAVMQGGKLQQIAQPMEVYRRPASQFVAGFIGSPAMNFLDVEIGRQDGRLWSPWAERPSSCRSRPGLGRPGTLDRGTKAVMGIRPTDLVVGVHRDLDLVGDVFLVEPIGPISYVDADIAALR